MKVSKEERILKETALEALELALQQNGLVRRPKHGKQGWAAVEQVMVWWKGEHWPSLPKERQADDLRTATAWRSYQVGKVSESSEIHQAICTTINCIVLHIFNRCIRVRSFCIICLLHNFPSLMTCARTILPAALDFVSLGFELVRV